MKSGSPYALGDEIPGWFYPEDRDVFTAVLEQGGTGDILEIGCYLGKSAILLGYGTSSASELICCDLWGDDTDGLTGDEPAIFSSLTLNQFLDNWHRYHDWQPVIRQCSSLNLDLTGRQLRFSHIDGSHRYDYAAHDIELAARYTVWDGVIAIDDWSAEHLPGVAAATWHAQQAGQIYPFLVTPHKLYAAITPEGCNLWIKRFAEKCWGQTHKFPGFDLLVVARCGTGSQE